MSRAESRRDARETWNRLKKHDPKLSLAEAVKFMEFHRKMFDEQLKEIYETGKIGVTREVK